MVEDKVAVLARLAGLLARGGAQVPLATRMGQACVDLTGAAGAAITYAPTDPTRVTLCVTTTVADRLEDLQEVLGEGPGWDAHRSGTAVSAVLPQESRWPLFTPAALREVGPVVLHALPMRPGGDVIGVLTLHASPDDPPPDLDTAQFLADAVGAALLRDTGWHDDGTNPWHARSKIYQATGMVVSQLAISPDDALALLKAHAYAHDASLDVVAGLVLDRQLRFTGTQRGETSDSETSDSEAEKDT
jgi:hypothetical protein